MPIDHISLVRNNCNKYQARYQYEVYAVKEIYNNARLYMARSTVKPSASFMFSDTLFTSTSQILVGGQCPLLEK